MGSVEVAMGGSPDAEPAPSALLELADWRRRVADLYAAVRVDAARDPQAAWEGWRAVRAGERLT